MKHYYEQSRIGSSKYVVNYHDGLKLHSDGSAFYDIRIFTSKLSKDAFINYLIRIGYVTDAFNCAKCGKLAARATAVEDTGEGPEAGSKFLYCSEDCRIRH